MSDLSSIFYRHASNVDVYTMDSSDFAEACREAVEAGLVGPAPHVFDTSGFVVDLKGRIYKDGICIAFLNRHADNSDLNNFIEQLGASLPYFDDVVQMVEKEP